MEGEVSQSNIAEVRVENARCKQPQPLPVEEVNPIPGEATPDTTREAIMIDAPGIQLRKLFAIKQRVADHKGGIAWNEPEMVIQPVHCAANELITALKRYRPVRSYTLRGSTP
jgi:hypothetical protein